MMRKLCLRAGSHFLSPPPPLPPIRLTTSLHLLKPYSSSSSPPPSISPIKMSTQIVEHIVLFKVKPDTSPSKIDTMISRLNGLNSLDQVLHLAAGPLLRTRSSSPFTFTHMLHSRYKSKDDLDSYSTHPSHVAVVAESGRPICDDIMAVDWVQTDLTGPVVPRPGSVMRLTLVKLKEGLGDTEKKEVLDVIGAVKDLLPSIDQISFGENFSPARAKGFSIGSLAIFPGLSELDSLDSDSNLELVNMQKDKVRSLIESVIVLDYVIPVISETSSL